MPTVSQETSRGKRRRNGMPATKRRFAGQAPLSTVRFRADSDGRDRDDFRTALNQATSYLKSFATTSRASSTSPAPSSSSSSPASLTNSDLDKSRIDIMNKSLACDNKHAVEREQVIKLIRTVVDIVSEKRDRQGNAGSSWIPLSEPIMRAFVAVAEHADDPFRQICVQTLAEMSLLDIDLVARAGGIRFLLHALGEGPVEIRPILAATFLHVIDSPRTRAYLRLGIDVEVHHKVMLFVPLRWLARLRSWQ
ncbi:Rapamycin-insensitive companion of mTOR, N-term-domain-containing protein [Chiua virens]|nr:Rapamycin-insensitive companion of mTOR, N-term-domain-containing protein [Chiua virens]